MNVAVPLEDSALTSAGTIQNTAHDALFAGQVEGLLVAVAEGEFPLMGTAAWLDWLCRGTLSDFHAKGVLTGRSGEITYLPIRHRTRTLHLLLVGIGSTRTPNARPSQTPPSIRRALTNAEAERIITALSGLGIARWGLSKADFPGTSDEILTALSKAAGELALFD